MKALAIGTIELQIPDGKIDVHGVLKIPALATNLLSVSGICKRGHTMVFTTEKCKALNVQGELIISGKEEGGGPF